MDRMRLCSRSLRALTFMGGFFAACAAPLQVPQGETILRIAVDPAALQVEEIPLERYLVGVLSQETPADWPLEALKAQAVAARTYALYRKEHPRSDRYDLAADMSDQVFQQRESYDPAYVRAVQETVGETLEYGGKTIPAFFHSCCGGITERADRVWNDSSEVEMTPLLLHQNDPFCEACPRYHWELTSTREDFGQTLSQAGIDVADGWELAIGHRDDSGRVATVLLSSSNGTQVIRGDQLRQMVGPLKLRSTLFDLERAGETLTFRGKGAGHGVGLCQWGARGMAELGYPYGEILGFYYPGAQLVRPADPKAPPPDLE